MQLQSPRSMVRSASQQRCLSNLIRLPPANSRTVSERSRLSFRAWFLTTAESWPGNATGDGKRARLRFNGSSIVVPLGVAVRCEPAFRTWTDGSTPLLPDFARSVRPRPLYRFLLGPVVCAVVPADARSRRTRCGSRPTTSYRSRQAIPSRRSPVCPRCFSTMGRRGSFRRKCASPCSTAIGTLGRSFVVRYTRLFDL